VRQQAQVSRTVIRRRTVTPIFTATERIEYRHRDHLGSVEAVTDESGTLITDLAFDPFGDRREPDWSRALTSAALDLLLTDESTTARGFTGHEHLDRTGFIHMKRLMVGGPPVSFQIGQIQRRRGETLLRIRDHSELLK